MDAVSTLDNDTTSQPKGFVMIREEIKTTEGLLRHDLARFRAWRCHTDADFKEWFNATQKWQTERLKKSHAHLLLDERYQAVTQFFLTDMYGGLDLTSLANEIERALPTTIRLLPDSVMRTAATALELNALTGELDELTTSMLFETMGVSEITDAAMVEAYQRAGSPAMRERQMMLARELGSGLDKYVRSHVIYATFKIASKPLHMAGLGVLYDFLDRGFAVMRPMGSAEEFLDLFIDKEKAIMDNIYANRPNPFEF